MKKLTDQQLQVLFPMARKVFLKIRFDNEINRFLDTEDFAIDSRVFHSLQNNDYIQYCFNGCFNGNNYFYVITPKGVDAVYARCNTKFFRTLERKYGMMPNKNKGKP